MEPNYKDAFEYVFMVLFRLAHLNGTKLIDSGTLGHLIPEIRKFIRENYGVETHGEILAEERERGNGVAGLEADGR
jgi:hypothetical protein